MDWWKPWEWLKARDLMSQARDMGDELFEKAAEAPSTYPRFTYLVGWKYVPEPRRALKDSAIHFERQLTQRQVRDVVHALNGRDPRFRCTGIKAVTGKPAAIALSTFGIQKQA